MPCQQVAPSLCTADPALKQQAMLRPSDAGGASLDAQFTLLRRSSSLMRPLWSDVQREHFEEYTVAQGVDLFGFAKRVVVPCLLCE